MIPIPRSSIKCLVISGARPTSVASLTFLISTTSSATRRWPLLISSRAASDLPIPLSPMIGTPSPYTSTSTACTDILGASSTWSQRSTSCTNADVTALDVRTGTPCFFPASIINSYGSRSLQNIRHGGLYEKNSFMILIFSSSVCIAAI